MQFKTLSEWMRAPGGRVLDTRVFALEQHIFQLEQKFVALRRQQRFEDLYRQYQAAKRTGKTHKRWVSQHSATSRRSHIHAHGQVVPIDAHFTIGHERLFLPSDPNAPFAETANCACTVVF